MLAAHPRPAHQALLPLAVIASALLHLGAAYALLFHPMFDSSDPFRDILKVKIVELPAGVGGATEGEVGSVEEPDPPPPPEVEPVKEKPPKTTLPGDEKPKPKDGGPSAVKSDKPGKALGLGHGGPAGLGGKQPGILLDQATFEYEWYKARLEDTLKTHWMKPPPKGSRVTSASVHFVISSAGEATEIKLLKSSGDPTFDQSVLRAISDSVPFPKFPPAYQEDRLGVLYTFELLPEK